MSSLLFAAKHLFVGSYLKRKERKSTSNENEIYLIVEYIFSAEALFGDTAVQKSNQHIKSSVGFFEGVEGQAGITGEKPLGEE